MEPRLVFLLEQEFGSNDEVLNYVESIIGEEPVVKVYEREVGFFDSFGGMRSKSVLENKGVEVELR